GRARAAERLGGGEGLGERERAALLALLRDEDPQVRDRALRAAAYDRSPETVEVLLELLAPTSGRCGSTPPTPWPSGTTRGRWRRTSGWAHWAPNTRTIPARRGCGGGGSGTNPAAEPGPGRPGPVVRYELAVTGRGRDTP
ncbi:HEAT repeat domain-containing protein, partial [Streptomyces sp. NPDC048551]|uniref:HEAT repeat domain-containing protein n=1 Tax=Streptomyces sp. NPDC048551 TaxID=3155758 RepID=UPI003415D4FC